MTEKLQINKEDGIIVSAAVARLAIESLVIDSDQKLIEANDLLREIVAKRAADETALIELTGMDRLKDAYDKAKEKVNKFRKAYDSMREAIEQKMAAYRTQREKDRLAYEAKVEAESKQIRDRQLNKAEMLRAKGRVDEAIVAEAIANLPMPVIPDAKVQLEGTATYEDYDIEITDLLAFIKAVAAEEIPLKGIVQRKPQAILDVRESVVKYFARSAKGNLDWPGLKITPKTKFRVSAKEDIELMGT